MRGFVEGSPGTQAFRVWELTSEWGLSPMPAPPDTVAPGNTLFLAAVEGRPCIGYPLDNAAGGAPDSTPYVACIDAAGSWQELPMPGPRRADQLWGLTVANGRLFAMTLEEVGIGTGGERVFHTLRWEGASWVEEPVLRVRGGRGEARFAQVVRGSRLGLVVGVSDPERGTRRVLMRAGSGWRDLVRPIPGRNLLQERPVVRGRTVLMPDFQLVGRARRRTLRFTLLAAPTSGAPARRFGEGELSRVGYLSVFGTVGYASGRFWTAWTASSFGTGLPDEASAFFSAVDVANGRLARRRVLWRGRIITYRPEVVELRRNAFALYFVPVRGQQLRPMLRRIEP